MFVPNGVYSVETLKLALKEQWESFVAYLTLPGRGEIPLDQNFSVCKWLPVGLPRAAKSVCGVAWQES